MSFLCKIGLHKWRQVGLGSLVMPVFIDRCERCGCGRANGGHYTESYTKEQMDAALNQRGGSK